MKLSKIFFALILLCAPIFLIGQKTVTGILTDGQTGETLIGANILVTGSSIGTVSDIDGIYSLIVPEGYNQITFSYTGYNTVTVDIGDRSQIDITMAVGAILDEVVVIGYGTVKKEDATGSIQTVSTEKFNKGNISTPQELLVGKVAGVQITTNSGAPGDGAQIRIRGGSSLSASNDPLIVIDGVPIEAGGVNGSRNPLNLINPNDIETFTVLKDASATAIYGSRASNGVILITTKKGSTGAKTRINYNGNFSISNRIADTDVLNADEFRAIIASTFAADHPAQDLLGTENTNWQEQIYQSSVGMDHNLSATGSLGETLPYRVSGGYSNKNGILKTDQFNRLTGALSLTPGFIDNTLQLNLNVKGVKINNTFADRGAISNAIRMDPTRPIFDSESPYKGYYTWTIPSNGLPNQLAPNNPLALLDLTNDESEVTRLITSLAIDYRLPFLPGLRANLNVANDASSGNGTKVVPVEAAFAFDSQTGGGVNNVYTQDKKNQLLEFYLNYTKNLGKHKIDILGGYSWQRFFFEDSFKDSNTAGTPGETTEGTNSGELFLLSLYGRVNATLFDKLLLTATLRRDGSSRFSPENRWGLFPAAAVAYKLVDNEAGNINSLKLRLGYGVTGQQDIGSYYQYQSRYLASFTNAQYQFGSEFVSTLRPEGYDAEIKWEETTTYNVGLDYSLFKNRINGSIELYQRNTIDLLNFIRVPAGTNLTNFIDTNVGSLENNGVEFTVNATPVLKDNFSWDIGFNVTANKNKITKLNFTDDPEYLGVATGGISGGVGNTIQIHSVGFPSNSFLVYEQVYNEDGKPIEGLYVDRNEDGVVDSEDQYRLEKPAPDMFFGINTAVNAGNFTLSLAGRANIGNYVYNNNLSDRGVTSGLFHPSLYLSNTISEVNEIGFVNQQFLSDYFIQEASFFRLDYVSLSYNFEKLLSNGLTLSATLQNPILITNYTGVDPEISSGIDNNVYPRARTFVFGVNANL